MTYKQVLAEYADRMSQDWNENDMGFGRYLLVQEDHRDCWISAHDSLQSAADYIDGEEIAWTTIGLYDTQARRQQPREYRSRTVWVPVVQQAEVTHVPA